MQPCKGGAAERHNRRDKELDYIRKDMTHLNHYREWITISDQMKKIRSEYEAATGQKLQSTSRPIQEIVLVIDKSTTPEQVEKFCSLTRNLGMTPLSYAIHKDEGHTDAGTGEWIPNYHAHIVVDTTCWEHKQVERTRKKNGKNVIDPKTHKPEKVMVDAYAKTIKFTREDMARLQDFAAEATGLERGVSSDRMHEEARQFKAREQAREIMEQAKEIEVQEETIRSCVVEMQQQGKEVVKNFDAQNKKGLEMGIEADPGILQRRDWLESTTKKDLSLSPASALLKLLQPLSNAITVVAMAAAALATTLANSLAKSVEEKRKMLSALTRQIKAQSIWKSTKGAILSLMDKPANKQVESLQNEMAAKQSENEAMQKESMQQAQEISTMRQELTEQQMVREVNKSLIYENSVLQGQVNKLQSDLAKESQKHQSWLSDFIGIAEDLIDHAGPELLQHYESRGLHKLVGENIWDKAKATKEERAAERKRLSQSSVRGRHM